MCTKLTDKEEKQETEMIEGSCWSLFQEPRRCETCPEALGCARAETGTAARRPGRWVLSDLFLNPVLVLDSL